MCCRNCKVLVSEWIEKNWARVEGSRKAKEEEKKRKTDSTVYLAAKVAHCTEIEQE